MAPVGYNAYLVAIAAAGEARRGMEFHQIRYFLTVAETLNFTRAAERCAVSQPALTRDLLLQLDW